MSRTAAIGLLTFTERESIGANIYVDVSESGFGYIGELCLSPEVFESLLARETPEIELRPGVVAPGGDPSQVGDPFISLSCGPMSGDLTPGALEALAVRCLKAAVQARTDANLVDWMTGPMGMSAERAVEALRDTRIREEQRDGRPIDDD